MSAAVARDGDDDEHFAVTVGFSAPVDVDDGAFRFAAASPVRVIAAAAADDGLSARVAFVADAQPLPSLSLVLLPDKLRDRRAPFGAVADTLVALSLPVAAAPSWHIDPFRPPFTAASLRFPPTAANALSLSPHFSVDGKALSAAAAPLLSLDSRRLLCVHQTDIFSH